VGQTITSSPHRLSIGSSTTTTAGNGSPTSQSAPTPASASALTSVGIELNEMQPGKFSNLQITANYILCLSSSYKNTFISLVVAYIIIIANNNNNNNIVNVNNIVCIVNTFLYS